MNNILERHRRAAHAFCEVLNADDKECWNALPGVFAARLTRLERLRTATAAVASLPDDIMSELREMIEADVPPHPSFVLDRIGADRWAELADRQDQRLIMGACWRRMQDRDRWAFREFTDEAHEVPA